jgi:phage terminase large subunit
MAARKVRIPKAGLTVQLPNNWRPRWYQGSMWDYFMNGGKRGVAVCHRRWGKDDMALHLTAVKSQQRPGVYWHLLPEASQARKAIWTAVNPHTGIRRIDEAFPHALRESTNENEMFIRFKNGALWQVVGSDNYNSLVGSPPIGLVMSEWALANPAAWAYLRPILLENGGWAFFIYTARGRNHGHKTWVLSQTETDWYGVRQTARDTDVFTPEQLDGELREYISDYGEEDGTALFEQEYLCSFDAAVIGAYYARALARLDQQGRITSVPYDPNYPVFTAWDLGIDDATAVWFAQPIGREWRIIDYYEARNRALTDIARDLLTTKPYVYAKHWAPHDIEARELTHAKTRREVIESLGLRPIYPGAQRDASERINAVRMFLSKCVFDAVKCEKGLQALRHYRVDYDEKNKTPRKTPKHDWSSHASDAFGELAMQAGTALPPPRQVVANSDYDIFGASSPDYANNANRGAYVNPIPNVTPANTLREVVSDWDPLEADYR